jgi:hypothetical protein
MQCKIDMICSLRLSFSAEGAVPFYAFRNPTVDFEHYQESRFQSLCSAGPVRIRQGRHNWS